MKLFSLVVLYKGQDNAQVLKAAHDLASFSFFQRSSIQVIEDEIALVPYIT